MSFPFNTQVLTPAVASPVYCNGVQIAVSEWDLTCVFVHSSPTGFSSEPGEIEPQQRVVQAVVMSPQHAKALALLLTRNVARWEEAHGAISLSEAVLQAAENPPMPAPPAPEAE